MTPSIRRMEWSEEDSLHLIEAYKNMPILWDAKVKSYTTKRKRGEAWDTLGAEFGVGAYEVKRKMESLLASFRRERHKVATGRGEHFRSRWFAFNSFNFLMEIFKTKQGEEWPDDEHITLDLNEEETVIECSNGDAAETSNVMGEQQQEGAESESLNNNEVNLPPSEPKEEEAEEEENVHEPIIFLTPKKALLSQKRKATEEMKVQKALDLVQQLADKKKLRDDCSIYSEHIANKLRTYDFRVRAIVEHHINNILFEADMGKYNQRPLLNPTVSTFKKNASSKRKRF